ncbi:MAG: hypothetical protein HYT98_02205 [Candidatus Sungbacteria bacterium]|nr:hypothetical protein [Candidatus Sungbacteria bacterium]
MSDRKAPYDTNEGIQRAVKTLHKLNELVANRHRAGYERHERLKEFYVLGRWRTDSCGNFGKIISEFIPKLKFPQIPDVLTNEEFWAFLGAQGLDVEKTFVSSGMSNDLPPDDIVCCVCQQSWTIENCHDVVITHQHQDFSLSEFVGRQLWEVQRVYGMRIDACYRMQPDILIRNDRFIDLRPEPEFETLKRNEHGWVGKEDGVTENYVIQSGDDGFFNVWHFHHHACSRKKLEADMRQQFRDVLTKAGFANTILKSIPNQYCPCEHCAPWFVVRTEHGTFTIGWRKRVINIDWKATGKNFLPLFDDQDVTKDNHLIHAWGYEKATEYFTRIKGFLIQSEALTQR